MRNYEKYTGGGVTLSQAEKIKLLQKSFDDGAILKAEFDRSFTTINAETDDIGTRTVAIQASDELYIIIKTLNLALQVFFRS